MKYLGIQTQIYRNNLKSIFLLLMFPVIILLFVWLFLALLNYMGTGYYDEAGNVVHELDAATVNYYFLSTIPWVVGGVGVWFLIAYFWNVRMIQRSTGARFLSRKENPRLYNIVENLCMSCGMDTPKINIVDDAQLNAFASGINRQSYTVTVTRGLLDTLTDEELEGVIGHELTHIRHRDTRLLVTSIVFVGIISTVMSLAVRMLYNVSYYGGGNRRVGGSGDGRGNGLTVIAILIAALVCSALAYFFSMLTRFAISRKREYMADAGSAELTGNPRALASALRKIAANPGLDGVKQEEVAQLFIMRPDEMDQGLLTLLNSLFSTHPDPQKRIEILEQF